MNYVKHINSTFQQFYSDSRLLPGHISLYMAMFFYWNLGRFPDTLNIDRIKLMKMAKISSRTTYYKLIRNLSDWNYVEYIPPKIPNGTTTVNMTNICTGKGPIFELESSKNEQRCPKFGHPTIYN